MAKIDWTPAEYAPSSGSFEPIPKGAYPAVLTRIGLKSTKDKTGQYLEVEHTLSDPNYKNRKVWARLNVHNRSDIAQRIGREQYSALCAAAGKPGASDTDLLLNRPVTVYISVSDDQRGNDVNGWAAPSGGSASPSARAPEKKKEPKREEPARRFNDDGDTPAEDDIPF